MLSADYSRLRTWIIKIAEELLPGSRPEDRGADVHLTASGGLAISKRNGAWFRHTDGVGSYSTISLIALLRQCGIAEAVDWAKAWLASHDGTGDCGTDDAEDSASEAAAAASKSHAEKMLKQAGPADGTVVPTYLNKRGINVLPACIKNSPDARNGESAMVAVLRARGVDVGIHCTYLDALGCKSLREPVRQTFLTDRSRGKGAVCVLQESKDATLPVLLAEGVEDGLSLLACGRSETVWAMPGVRVLAHVEVPRKRKVIVVRDGDEPGSEADKALIEGLDHLLLTLGDDAVRVTQTPLRTDPAANKVDANSILTSGPDGAAQLRALVDTAVPATLSFGGQVKKLARLQASADPDDAVEYARLRTALVTKFTGLTLDRLNHLVRAERLAASGQEAGNGGRPPKQADVLIELAKSAELFHTPNDIAYADLEIDGHRETWPIKSSGFKRWLLRRYFEETGGAPNSEALTSARSTIEAQARYSPTTRAVHLRVGELDGKIYLDLCDPSWRAVEIDKTGWRIADHPAIRFRRHPDVEALPDPVRNGSINGLRPLLNIPNTEDGDGDFVMAIAYLLAALRGRGTFPFMAVAGEQGTAKSTRSELLIRMVDPGRPYLRGPLRDEHELYVAVHNRYMLGFDNMPSLRAWLSDAFCRITDGTGFAKRELYTDLDEVKIEGARPIVGNGIEDIIERPDLAERTLFSICPPIPDENRLTRDEINKAFITTQPSILGALLDAVATGLRNAPNIRPRKLPRMADFAKWVIACEPALWKEGMFMRAYNANMAGAVESTIEASPVAMAVRTFMKVRTLWEGTASELLAELGAAAGERATNSKEWPKSARALSGRLRRAASFLRRVGIDIQFQDRHQGRKRVRGITLTAEPSADTADKVGEFASAPSADTADNAGEFASAPSAAPTPGGGPDEAPEEGQVPSVGSGFFASAPYVPYAPYNSLDKSMTFADANENEFASAKAGFASAGPEGGGPSSVRTQNAYGADANDNFASASNPLKSHKAYGAYGADAKKQTFSGRGVEIFSLPREDTTSGGSATSGSSAPLPEFGCIFAYAADAELLHLLREVSALGVKFRISGADVVISGADHLPTDLKASLDAANADGRLFEHLDGDGGADKPMALLDRLGVTAVLVETRAAARAAVRQIILARRKHPGPIGLDIETTPLPQHRRERPPVRLNKNGSLSKQQPEHTNPGGLSPHTARISTLQLYAGETHSHIWRSKDGDFPCTPTGEEYPHDDGRIYAKVEETRTAVPKDELFPDRRGRCFIFRGEALELLLASDWLRAQHLVAHNATFETAFLRHYTKPSPQRRRPGRLECSMQATGLLRGIGNRSLADAAGAVLRLEVSKDVRSSDWGAARLSRGQIAYAALDAVLAYRLWPLLDEQMAAKDREGAYNLQRRAVLPVADMELRGVLLDRDAHAELTGKWSRELAQARQRYHEMAGKPPPATPNQIRDWLADVLEPAQINNWPHTESGDQLSVAAKHLKRLVRIPTARPMLDIIAWEKLLQNFGASLAALINPATGRLHAHYNIAGAKSGRFTCGNPNLQQLPSQRAPDFKKCIVAAPGYMLVGCDWNQIEVRAAAWISDDPAMTKIYAEGRDIHRETAASFIGVGIEAVAKEQRQAAKPVVFGSIYGIGAKALAESAFADYGIVMSEAQAQQALDAFFRRFSMFNFWRRQHAGICRAQGIVKIGAGRVVEAAWEKEGQISFPQACNLPIQGICADAMLRAIVLVHHRFVAANIRGGLIASVHDELLAEVAEDDAERARILMQEAMHEAFVTTFPDAPTTGVAKAVIGHTWFDLKQDEPPPAPSNAFTASAQQQQH